MRYINRRLRIFYKKREKINIARPLLTLNRLQISKICIFLNLPICVDSTNQLINFRRNRLRRQVFPLFKIFFNPKIDLALTKFISIINTENDYFSNHLKNIEKIVKIRELHSQSVRKNYNPKWLIFLPHALQRKFYQKLLIYHFKTLTYREIEFLLKINIYLSNKNSKVKNEIS